MKKTIVLSLVFLMVAVITEISAQKPHGMHPGMKVMNPEMKSYIQENVIPVMKVQRVELDKELSGTEKARLAEIRSEMKIMRQQKAEKMKEFQQNDERPTVEQRKEMREMRNQMHNMMDEVAVMAEDHDATISKLLGEVKTEQEQWRQDMRAIMEKGRKDCMMREDFQKPGMGKRGQPGRYHGEGVPLRRLLNPETFLLWNPDEPLPFFGEQAGLEDNLQLNVYPNPASQNTQISIQLENETMVSFIIFDKDGNEVMNLNAEHSAAGIYSRTIDVSDLTNGLYLIKINAGEKSSIDRLIIQH
jgi:hypothetical protein